MQFRGHLALLLDQVLNMVVPLAPWCKFLTTNANAELKPVGEDFNSSSWDHFSISEIVKNVEPFLKLAADDAPGQALGLKQVLLLRKGFSLRRLLLHVQSLLVFLSDH